MISVIVPVLNEEETLARHFSVFKSLSDQSSIDLIFVDGGSKDSSRSVIESIGARCISAPKGRAVQMNAGASYAEGSWLLFLHADSIITSDQINQILQQTQRWGRFDIRLDSDKFRYRVIEWFINKRSRFTAISTGDQCQFFSKALFNDLGGFSPIPLMEDIDISKRLKKQGIQPANIDSKVITSSRRWETRGTIRTILLMWKLRLLYWLGVSAERLSKHYV